jgi:hypothetical protein
MKSRIQPQTCQYCRHTITPRQKAQRSRPIAEAFTDPQAFHIEGGKALGALHGDCWAAHVRRQIDAMPKADAGVNPLRFGR